MGTLVTLEAGGGIISLGRRTHTAMNMFIGQPVRRGGEKRIGRQLQEHRPRLQTKGDWRITCAYETEHAFLGTKLDAEDVPRSEISRVS